MSERYTLTDSLGYRITLFSRISERRFERALSPLGLSRVTWCVLLAVGQEGLQNPSEIAAYIGIDRTATSRALGRLERDGMVLRQNACSDKRKTEVRLTETGRRNLLHATEAARENAAYFNRKLSWYEQSTLSDALEKLMQGETRDVSGL